MTTKRQHSKYSWKEKDSVLQIRLPEHEKQQFLEICASIDTTGARELRGFIRQFIQKNNQRDLL